MMGGFAWGSWRWRRGAEHEEPAMPSPALYRRSENAGVGSSGLSGIRERTMVRGEAAAFRSI